jgi:hypothetical protein
MIFFGSRNFNVPMNDLEGPEVGRRIMTSPSIDRLAIDVEGVHAPTLEDARRVPTPSGTGHTNEE